jgi:hypothetical protein
MELNIGHMLEVFIEGTQGYPARVQSPSFQDRFRFTRSTFGTNRFQNFAIPSAVRSSADINNKALARKQSTSNLADQGIVFNNGQYTFLPFSFNGAISTLTGDNVDATLEIANTRISRDFAVRYLDRGYIAKVRTVLWSSETKIPFAPGTIHVEQSLCEYVGVCSSGGWNDRKLQIKLGSVLDAVQSNVPGRRLRREQVGNLPHTAQVAI